MSDDKNGGFAGLPEHLQARTIGPLYDAGVAASADRLTRTLAELSTLRAQLAEANAKLAVAVGALKWTEEVWPQRKDDPTAATVDMTMAEFLAMRAAYRTLPAQAAQMLAVVAAARDVAMKYDDFSEPERGAPREYNERRRALYDALNDFDANRETTRTDRSDG